MYLLREATSLMTLVCEVNKYIATCTENCFQQITNFFFSLSVSFQKMCINTDDMNTKYKQRPLAMSYQREDYQKV